MEAIKVFRKGNDVIKIEPVDHYEEEIIHGNIDEFVVFRKRLIRRCRIKKKALKKTNLEDLKELCKALGIKAPKNKGELIEEVLKVCAPEEEQTSEKKNNDKK